jgi:hypothetical protein
MNKYCNEIAIENAVRMYLNIAVIFGDSQFLYPAPQWFDNSKVTYLSPTKKSGKNAS